MTAHAAQVLLVRVAVKAGAKRVALLVVVAGVAACAKEEWNRNQLGVRNPYTTEADDTEPADESTEDGSNATAAPTTIPAADAGADGPADARSDARDATAG